MRIRLDRTFQEDFLEALGCSGLLFTYEIKMRQMFVRWLNHFYIINARQPNPRKLNLKLKKLICIAIPFYFARNSP